MLRSLYSGISGMQGFQTKLDVIGNNIANVNTTGFKKQRVDFQDMLSQNLRAATAPDGGQGGVNPQQVGLGVQIGAIDTIHTQGAPMTTNNPTDLAIEGDGFFMVIPPGVDEPMLTRAGNLTFDSNGGLVTSDGFPVLDTDEDPIDLDDILGAGYDLQDIEEIEISSDGTVVITLLDGEVIDGENGAPQIGVARVANPEGLRQFGGSLYQTTVNSGDLEVLDLNQSQTQIVSGALEMSNVDLSEEFSEMIVAQRGFQSNARTITTADEVLQELTQLKR